LHAKSPRAGDDSRCSRTSSVTPRCTRWAPRFIQADHRCTSSADHSLVTAACPLIWDTPGIRSLQVLPCDTACYPLHRDITRVRPLPRVHPGRATQVQVHITRTIIPIDMGGTLSERRVCRRPQVCRDSTAVDSRRRQSTRQSAGTGMDMGMWPKTMGSGPQPRDSQMRSWKYTLRS
jgi:hypothetical protein